MKYLSRTEFSLTVFYNQKIESQETFILKKIIQENKEEWFCVSDKTDPELADLILSKEIDILKGNI